ncbi:MAG: hypothetical protein H5T74_01050 [Actinobacteria bacterium]|nr:hypothetical protein [Actinomycetota bacterium]
MITARAVTRMAASLRERGLRGQSVLLLKKCHAGMVASVPMASTAHALKTFRSAAAQAVQRRSKIYSMTKRRR